MRKIFGIITLLLLIINGSQNLGAQNREISKRVNKTGKVDNHTILVNHNREGNQLTRFDSAGAALDAHDGEIALFNGIYYLYGTSYDCGYEWGNKSSSFCGFKAYSSNDLVNWTDRGFLFDAKTAIWQTRCNGGTYGCYRPHVIYNQANKMFVLWINVYDNRVRVRLGFLALVRVFSVRVMGRVSWGYG